MQCPVSPLFLGCIWRYSFVALVRQCFDFTVSQHFDKWCGVADSMKFVLKENEKKRIGRDGQDKDGVGVGGLAGTFF